MRRFLGILLARAPAVATAQMPMTMMHEPDSVSVTGMGRSTVVPDRFTFSVGVQTVAEAVDAAVNENNTKSAAVIAALKRAGATDADIRTSGFSIWPQQDYNAPQTGRPPRIVGYQVSNNISVRRNNIAEAGKLLQVAVNAGVNSASGLQFEVSDPAKGRDQGLRAAFDDARSKAQLLATAAGRTLGPALHISEGGNMPAPPPGPRVMAMKAEAVSEVPVEAGTQENTYTVSVVFELR